MAGIHIVTEGWLYKVAAASSSRKFWFVLDGPALKYFAQQIPVGALPTMPTAGVIRLPDARVRAANDAFGIEIKPLEGVSFLLEANRRAQRDRWLVKLKAAAELRTILQGAMDTTVKRVGVARAFRLQLERARGEQETSREARPDRTSSGAGRRCDDDDDAYDNDDDTDDDEGGAAHGCCSRCQRMCSMEELGARLKHGLGPISEFVEGAANYVLSRMPPCLATPSLAGVSSPSLSSSHSPTRRRLVKLPGNLFARPASDSILRELPGSRVQPRGARF
jgi:hypothetical protein